MSSLAQEASRPSYGGKGSEAGDMFCLGCFLVILGVVIFGPALFGDK